MHCADELGIRIVRDDEVFASWDGQGCLRLGRESLDADDCLAQLVLHELCHAVVEGPSTWNLPDWGLNDPRPKGRAHEFAALRLQAALADRFGLRSFFSATTDFFEYYRTLPPEPLEQPIPEDCRFQHLRSVTRNEDEAAIKMAHAGMLRWEASPWKAPMLHALESTRRIFDIVKRDAPADSLWHEPR